MSDDVRARVYITGRVQGVFYRAACRDAAARLDLRGWVRNAADGSVEAVAEGPREKVEAFVLWCHKGPPAARVTAVRVEWEPLQNESGFRITS